MEKRISFIIRTEAENNLIRNSLEKWVNHNIKKDENGKKIEIKIDEVKQ